METSSHWNRKKVLIHLVPHQESDPRPWGSTFSYYTTEATLQRTRWCSISMVSYVVHRKTRNPEVWRLTAEEKLVSHRCPQLMTKRKTTLFILLTNSCSCFIFSSGLSLQALLTMVIAISIFLAFKTEREKREIGLNLKALLVSSLLGKITTTN